MIRETVLRELVSDHRLAEAGVADHGHRQPLMVKSFERLASAGHRPGVHRCFPETELEIRHRIGEADSEEIVDQSRERRPRGLELHFIPLSSDFFRDASRTLQDVGERDVAGPM